MENISEKTAVVILNGLEIRGKTGNIKLDISKL